MRNLLSVLAIAGMCAVAANASVLATETFSYPDGAALSSNGWINHSGTVGDLLVSGGQAVVQHGVPSEDAHILFANAPGALYYGIDFSIDDLGAPWAGTDSEYFAHFMGDGTFNFTGRLDVVAPTGAGDFSVGISTFSGVAEATWAADLTFGTTYRAIVKYDQVANQAQLWIDALLESDTSILGVDQPDPGDFIDSFALRQSDSSENETVRVDNLIVATTFAEAVPEPGSIALLVIGGLAVLRRR